MSVPRATRIDPPSPLHELRIVKKLALRPDFFSGSTTPAERGTRLREHLEARGVGRERAFRASDETWFEACERWYGVGAVTSTDQPTPETVSP